LTEERNDSQKRDTSLVSNIATHNDVVSNDGSRDGISKNGGLKGGGSKVRG
jgi:hypothetical protein